MDATSNSILTENSSKSMPTLDWQRIVDMNPRIVPVAQRLAGIYGQEAGDLAQMLRLNLAMNQSPDLNARSDQYLLNRAAWDARTLLRKEWLHASRVDNQKDVDDVFAGDGDPEREVERRELSVRVRELVAELGDEAQAIARTIMDAGDELIRAAGDHKARQIVHPLNVSLLAQRAGSARPAGLSDTAWVKRVQRDVAQIRERLLPEIENWGA